MLGDAGRYLGFGLILSGKGAHWVLARRIGIAPSVQGVRYPVLPPVPVTVPPGGLPARRSVTMLPAMFIVTEADAASIRALFEQEGKLSAAIELRRRFPGIIDNAKARECVRTIAEWKSLPVPVSKVTRPPAC
jgi:hypothetical protein